MGGNMNNNFDESNDPMGQNNQSRNNGDEVKVDLQASSNSSNQNSNNQNPDNRPGAASSYRPMPESLRSQQRPFPGSPMGPGAQTNMQPSGTLQGGMQPGQPGMGVQVNQQQGPRSLYPSNAQQPNLNVNGQGQAPGQALGQTLGQVPPVPPNNPNQPMGDASQSPAPKAKKAGSAWMPVGIIFIIISLLLGGAFGWALMGYIDYRDNTNYKIAQAVADESKVVSKKMSDKFKEEAKQPYSVFVGPDDYGRVSFEYPRTWSVAVYNEESVGGKPFRAFLHPEVVPPESDKQQFAIRVIIEDIDYDKAVNKYANLVKKGDLKTSPVQVDMLNGTRLDGNFSKDIRGSAVMFKVRDKVLTIRTDANTFMADFDKLVQTISVME